MPRRVDRFAPRRATRHTETVQQLESWITTSKYPLHSRLPPERSLAESMQVSRGRLREALKFLEDEGRIWRCVGMGTFVGGRPRSILSRPEALGAATTLSEILEARSSIEPVIARLAAQRAQETDIRMIEHYSQAASKAQNWTDWERWDDLLHRAIVEASGNGLLINILDQLFRIKMHPRWTFKRADSFDAPLAQRYSQEHLAIISCITGRDGEGAEAAMRRHMLGLSLTVGPAISQSVRRPAA